MTLKKFAQVIGIVLLSVITSLYTQNMEPVVFNMPAGQYIEYNMDNDLSHWWTSEYSTDNREAMLDIGIKEGSYLYFIGYGEDVGGCGTIKFLVFDIKPTLRVRFIGSVIDIAHLGIKNYTMLMINTAGATKAAIYFFGTYGSDGNCQLEKIEISTSRN